MADTQRRPRRSKLILAGVLVVVVVGAAAFMWAVSQPGTGTMCTLAGVVQENASPSPEAAARGFVEQHDLAGSGTTPSDGGPAGFDRRSRTEWRRDLGDGSYQKLVVEEFPDGWRVVDANECSEVDV